MSSAYEYHPVANIFPMMSDDEFAALVEDIRANGQRQPIYVHDGRIIDGRNRYRACQQLGIEPEVRTWDGAGSLVSFVVSLNLQRRHLNSSQKALLGAEILPMLEAEAKERRRNSIKERDESGRAIPVVQKIEQLDVPSGRTPASVEQAAQMVGTNRQYVSDAKKLRDEAPELLERVRSGELTIPQARRALKEERREAVRADAAQKGAAIEKSSERFEIACAPCSSLLNRDAESVDWIVTDPPYPQEFLPVYAELSKAAAHVLKPGGSLLCMVGQSYLPEVVRMLSEKLAYHWTLAYLLPGGQASQLFDRSVNAFWKPVLWFVKGDYSGKWIGDVARSAPNANEKDGHRWQQSESGMLDLLRRFVQPGDVVADPFLGSGTTGVAALTLGCRFFGCDIDDQAVNISASRLVEVCRGS